MNGSHIWSRACGAYRRRLALRLGRRMVQLPKGRPIISFTFDDFPRSALENGGAILNRRGLSGTYYASFGLMEQITATGELFRPTDVTRLLAGGHELGCHTYDHFPAWETRPAAYEASVRKNLETMRRCAPGLPCRSHSFPISWPRPSSKKRLSRYFDCCRGGGQSVNLGWVDMNYLSAFFLEQSRDNPVAVGEIIELNRECGGWLIFATHDICDRPTKYGCTPEFFEEVVDAAVRSGADIMTVSSALKTLDARAGDAL